MKRAIMVAAVLLSVLVPIAVHAGFKGGPYTVTTDGSTYAYGSPSDTRNSANSVEYIGCDIYTYNTSGPTVRCIARSASNTLFVCTSTDQRFVSTVAAMTSHTYLNIQSDGSSNCTYMQLSNYSYFRPMTP